MSGFGEVLSRFTEFYAAGSYLEALALVTAELPNNPAYEAVLLCFATAMQARIGDLAGALANLRTALDRGYWIHEGALRTDPDFSALQAEPEFQAIVEQNAQRRQSAIASSQPVLRVLEPAGITHPAPLLIALHGNLGSADLFAGEWQAAVDLGWRVAVPQSSRSAWLSGFYDWQDIDLALNELDHHYQTLVSQYAVDPAGVVIAGFSLGGLIAARAAIAQRIPVRGLFWIEGAPDDDLPDLLFEQQSLAFRTYLAAGTSQDFLETAGIMAQLLHGVNTACEIETLPTTYHDIPPTFAQTVERALTFLTA